MSLTPFYHHPLNLSTNHRWFTVGVQLAAGEMIMTHGARAKYPPSQHTDPPGTQTSFYQVRAHS
jgi:hypothetical protein